MAGCVSARHGERGGVAGPAPAVSVSERWKRKLPDGSWKKVDADAGAPAGKTKTIVVDLEKELPPGARRLR